MDSGVAPFPALVSYQRFVEWMPSTLIPLSIYLHSCFGQWKGVSVMDSTKIAVCHNRRIKGHKVFKDIGRRGKTSFDW
ncbi:MAG TPA: transposase, partial [Leptolyngbyaceae cyanobacterium]